MNADHSVNCVACKRVTRPRGVRQEESPGTVLYRSLGLCAACWKRHKYGPRKLWRGKDLLEEVQALDGGPENIAQRLGLTPGGIARAARRQGEPELAVVFERAQWRRRQEAREKRN